MKSKLPSQKDIRGSITAEACVCCVALVILASLFFTLAGYCSCYSKVRKAVEREARDAAVLNHITGMAFAGMLDISDATVETGGAARGPTAYYYKSGNEIRIRTAYSYSSPLGDFPVRFESVFTAWQGDGGEPAGKTVWEYANFKRGRIIEERFGGGLPEFFPVLDSYDPMSGTAASITSMDTTLKTYRDGAGICEKLFSGIEELSVFTGARTGGFEICEKDIERREMLVIIPENPLTAGQLKAFEQCRSKATASGVAFTLKRYQRASGDAG